MNRDGFRVLPNPKQAAGMMLGKNEYVYICGHPDDMPAMLDLGRKIQETYHAEIRISEGKEEDFDREELKAILSEMKVVVFAVTKRFFGEDCVAGKTVFPLAASAGNLLLPVALEEGLGSAFTQRFGSFHLMNACAPDFGRKLQSFIERFVDLYIDISNIDTNPDRYLRHRVFFSYRKKDLADLKDLLRLLRCWKELTDVGIWYDDALVPGEDYNDQIKSKLEASHIFLLLVTPHLLENDNYVMKHEYPDAVAAGKTVIPVMMQDTDLQQLRELYPGVGEVFSLVEIKKAREAFCTALGKQSGQLPELTGEEWFLLGRAYASGEGTEWNPAMAKKALEESQRLGYVWALVRLSRDLDENGRMENAIPIMEQAFDRLGDMIRNDPEATKQSYSVIPTTRKLSDRLFRFYMQGGHWSKAFDLLMIQRGFSESTANPGLRDVITDPTVLNIRFGQVFFMTGDTVSAQEFFAKAGGFLARDSEIANSVMAHVLRAEGCAYYARTILTMLRLGQVLGAEPNLDRTRELLELGMEEIVDLAILGGMEGALDLARMVGQDYLRLLDDYQFFVPDRGRMKEMAEICGVFLDRFHIQGELLEEYRAAESDFPVDAVFNGSPEILRKKLDARSLWYELTIPREVFPSLFSFDGPVPEGVFGAREGNLTASGCKCPSCGKNMYVAMRPGRKPDRLLTGFLKDREFPFTESYLCPCGRIFAPLAGKSLTEGPVCSATVVYDTKNQLGRTLFDLWWQYFDMTM